MALFRGATEEKLEMHDHQLAVLMKFRNAMVQVWNSLFFLTPPGYPVVTHRMTSSSSSLLLVLLQLLMLLLQRLLLQLLPRKFFSLECVS